MVGRYAVYDQIAEGGAATVCFGRLLGSMGFTRTVAIKRLHAAFARCPKFVSMLIDEARLTARIRHPNVVPTLDVVAAAGELFVVMDYVHGVSLAQLTKGACATGQRIPARIVTRIVVDALRGLNAAHEARDELGRSLRIVHRDVSPHNIMVGCDGLTRVVDFGVAKATGRAQVSRPDALKGKLGYMAPEQLLGDPVTRRSDLYAAAVVLWETLLGRRSVDTNDIAELLQSRLSESCKAPSHFDPALAPFDAVVRRGLAHDPAERFATARAFAEALRDVVEPATPSDVGDWVSEAAAETLASRAALLGDIERRSGDWSAAEVLAQIERELCFSDSSTGHDAEAQVLSNAVRRAEAVVAGPVSAGPVSAGPVSDGPVDGRPVSAGPVSAGPVSDGPVDGRPVGGGPVGGRPWRDVTDEPTSVIVRAAKLPEHAASPNADHTASGSGPCVGPAPRSAARSRRRLFRPTVLMAAGALAFSSGTALGYVTLAAPRSAPLENPLTAITSPTVPSPNGPKYDNAEHASARSPAVDGVTRHHGPANRSTLDAERSKTQSVAKPNVHEPDTTAPITQPNRPPSTRQPKRPPRSPRTPEFTPGGL